MLARSRTTATVSRGDELHVDCTTSEAVSPGRPHSPVGEGNFDGAALGSRTPDLLSLSRLLSRLVSDTHLISFKRPLLEGSLIVGY